MSNNNENENQDESMRNFNRNAQSIRDIFKKQWQEKSAPATAPELTESERISQTIKNLEFDNFNYNKNFVTELKRETPAFLAKVCKQAVAEGKLNADSRIAKWAYNYHLEKGESSLSAKTILEHSDERLKLSSEELICYNKCYVEKDSDFAMQLAKENKPLYDKLKKIHFREPKKQPLPSYAGHIKYKK